MTTGGADSEGKAAGLSVGYMEVDEGVMDSLETFWADLLLRPALRPVGVSSRSSSCCIPRRGRFERLSASGMLLRSCEFEREFAVSVTRRFAEVLRAACEAEARDHKMRGEGLGAWK